jgi:hypothetical protein
MQKPLPLKPAAKQAPANIHTFQPINVPPAHDTNWVNATIEGMFGQARVPAITPNHLPRLKDKLRSLLFLASCFQFESIQLSLNLNELSFQAVAFEFKDEGLIYYENYTNVIPFFHRILASRNIMELLSTNIVTPQILLDCFLDEKKQTKLFLLDYNVCFEVFKAGVINFGQLWNINDNVIENLKLDACYLLVLKGKLRLDKIPFLQPGEREFLNNPVVIDLILEGRLSTDDWRYANTTPATQLDTLLVHNPRTHDNFVRAINNEKGKAIERSGVAMRP